MIHTTNLKKIFPPAGNKQKENSTFLNFICPWQSFHTFHLSGRRVRLHNFSILELFESAFPLVLR